MSVTIDAAVRAKQIVESLGGHWSGSRGECRCPAHDDHSPSLSVRLGTKAILFKCFAGCTSTDVLKALDRQGLHDREPVHVERSEEHTSELQSLMSISYAVFCLKQQNKQQ